MAGTSRSSQASSPSRQWSIADGEAGISSFADRPDAVGPYLRPLMEFAASVIPSSQHSTTPVYLLATAGMRLLPPVQQREILASTCTYLKQSYSFKVGNCAENIKIITGEEEGLYGWIAVNYLMDGFDKHQHALKGEAHSSTYGFLDMGGASTQIAFEPSEAERIKHGDNLLEVKMKLLSGKEVTHPVFVTTFLGFGTNQARSRYVEQAIQEVHVGTNPPAPLPVDSSSPPVLIDDPCLPKSLMISEPRHPGYTFRGTGSFAECVRKTAPLLNKNAACLDLPCLFNGVHVPAIDFSVNHFIGISEYWYSTQDVWKMGSIYDYVAFEKNAMEYCARHWDGIMADHAAGAKWKSGVELSRLEQQCFKAAWIVNVLHEGVGIPRIIDSDGEGSGKDVGEKGMGKAKEKGFAEKPKRPPSFQSLNQVNDVAISWTMGKMVLEVSQGSTSAGRLPLPAIASEAGQPPVRTESSPALGSAVSDGWRGRISAWPSELESTLSTAARVDPLAYLTLAAAVLVLYLFCLSPTSSRRRKSFLGGIFAGQRRSDWDALAVQDGNGAVGSDARTRSKANSSLVQSIRRGLARLFRSSSSALSNDRSFTLLPTSSGPRFEHPVPPPPRPRALRQTHSTPAFSRAPPQSGYYNDAPDVSERERGVGLPKSSHYFNSVHVEPTGIGSSTSHPPSRPATPAWASIPVPLPPRLSDDTADFDSSPSTPPAVPYVDSAAAGPMSTVGGGLGLGAKLRTSKSQNSSQINLAGGHFSNGAARRD